MRADLEAWEAQQGHPLDYPEKSKSYLLYRWADTLVHHPKVLDAVEDLIGPDILVYHSTMWIKEPHTPAHVAGTRTAPTSSSIRWSTSPPGWRSPRRRRRRAACGWSRARIACP